jgi:hypothetical protein
MSTWRTPTRSPDQHRQPFDELDAAIDQIGQVFKQYTLLLTAPLRHGVDHNPRKMPLGQPLAQARRQQQILLTVTRKKVLGHARIVRTAPDDTSRLCNSHRDSRK